jgi:hypothetical protein
MALSHNDRRQQAARNVLTEIVRGLCFVPEHLLDIMIPEARKAVEEALLTKDKRIGSSVLT